jgi:hypothetical protein
MRSRERPATRAIAAGFAPSAYACRIAAWSSVRASDVTAKVARRSAGPLPWEVLIVAPAGVFLTTLAARAAGDAYEPLKRLVLRIFELRRRPDRPDGAISSTRAVAP